MYMVQENVSLMQKILSVVAIIENDVGATVPINF